MMLSVLELSPVRDCLTIVKLQPRAHATCTTWTAQPTHLINIHCLTSQKWKILSFYISLHWPAWLDPVGCSEDSAEFPNNPCLSHAAGRSCLSREPGQLEHVYKWSSACGSSCYDLSKFISTSSLACGPWYSLGCNCSSPTDLPPRALLSLIPYCCQTTSYRRL